MARLGGFLGRRSDGEPSRQTLWAGLLRLQDMAEALVIPAHARGSTQSQENPGNSEPWSGRVPAGFTAVPYGSLIRVALYGATGWRRRLPIALPACRRAADVTGGSHDIPGTLNVD